MRVSPCTDDLLPSQPFPGNRQVLNSPCLSEDAGAEGKNTHTTSTRSQVFAAADPVCRLPAPPLIPYKQGTWFTGIQLRFPPWKHSVLQTLCLGILQQVPERKSNIRQSSQVLVACRTRPPSFSRVELGEWQGWGQEQGESKSIRKRTSRNGPSNNAEYPCNSGSKGLALSPRVLHRSLPTPKQDPCLRVLRATLKDTEMKTRSLNVAVLYYHLLL